MSAAALRRPIDETVQPIGPPPAPAVMYNTPGISQLSCMLTQLFTMTSSYNIIVAMWLV